MAEDPYSRLDKLMARAIAAAGGPALSIDGLRQKAVATFGQTQDVKAAERTVAEEVAMNSPFTATVAARYFQTALAGSPASDMTDKVAQAAEEVGKLAAVPTMSVGVELSNPHMMNDDVRGVGAIVCAALIAAISAGIMFVADLSGWAYSALGLIVVLLIVASLIFVMGYGSVKINVSPPSSGAGGESPK